jgi:hypothetical protein
VPQRLKPHPCGRVFPGVNAGVYPLMRPIPDLLFHLRAKYAGKWGTRRKEEDGRASGEPAEHVLSSMRPISSGERRTHQRRDGGATNAWQCHSNEDEKAAGKMPAAATANIAVPHCSLLNR